ncbi:MAG TPA: TetR/AcrR family transcriptional regulator [Solirubrobacterales bacterium]|jgi:AcrR family transcriptional regulator|nr:TetR/AcrR family transcriptional regulator [Solirubrobacterales bacterium]
MVVTPWGSSESLREGMLPPGPGRTPETVAENQRRRLFGAMVASVAERGYWNTRVADLVELSGVSLRSFYDLFPDKQACFVATTSALAATTIEAVLSGPSLEDWEEDSGRRLATLAAMVAAQPAAARLCLIESYVAGPEAAAVIEEATERAESLVRERLASSERWAELPAEMGTVAVAAIVEAFRSRLLKGQAQRLPEVAEEIGALLLSYEPPAQPLRSAARPPEVRPEEREASDHAERALRAFEALLTEQRYAGTTMEQVAKRAKMSVRTLYANFSDREDLMLAAVDSAGTLTAATVLPAYRRHPDSAEGIRAAFGALFALLGSRPNLAHLLLIAAFEGGAPALERRREALQPFEAMLTGAAPHRLAAPPKAIAEAILGGVIGLARRRFVAGGPAALASLGPICTFIALAPLLGTEQATAAAQGKSYRRVPSSLVEARRIAVLNPQTERTLTVVSHRAATIAEIAEQLPYSRDEIEKQISSLTEGGFVEAVQGGPEQEDQLYKTRWAVVETEEWGDRGVGEREQISAEIGWAVKEEVEEAFAAGTFDARPERHLVRLPMWLDEEGWQELSAALDESLEACLEVQRRVQERQKRTGSATGFPARVLLVSFEVPGRT